MWGVSNNLILQSGTGTSAITINQSNNILLNNATSALVAQWFTRSSLNHEVLGSRPEVDTGGALVV